MILSRAYICSLLPSVLKLRRTIDGILNFNTRNRTAKVRLCRHQALYIPNWNSRITRIHANISCSWSLLTDSRFSLVTITSINDSNICAWKMLRDFRIIIIVLKGFFC
jgi:hypothetical protein